MRGERNLGLNRERETQLKPEEPLPTTTMITIVVLPLVLFLFFFCFVLFFFFFFPIIHDLREREMMQFNPFILVSVAICYFSPICWFVLSFLLGFGWFQIWWFDIEFSLASCILGFRQRSCAHYMCKIVGV